MEAHKYFSMTKSLHTLVIFLIVTAFIGDCRSNAPASLDINKVQWATYSNTSVKYFLNYPNIYTVDEDDNGSNVFFRYDGTPPLVIRFTDEVAGKNRGLWFGNKVVESIELGGKKGFKYVYEHYDGPFYIQTIAYVVEHRGKFIGLEFRTDSTELDEVQQQILKSFKFR